MKLTTRQIELAKECVTAEELVNKSEEFGQNLTVEEAQKIIESVSMVEIDSDGLDLVSGGCNSIYHSADGVNCPFCNSTNTVGNGRKDQDYIYLTCQDCNGEFPHRINKIG